MCSTARITKMTAARKRHQLNVVANKGVDVNTNCARPKRMPRRPFWPRVIFQYFPRSGKYNIRGRTTSAGHTVPVRLLSRSGRKHWPAEDLRATIQLVQRPASIDERLAIRTTNGSGTSYEEHLRQEYRARSSSYAALYDWVNISRTLAQARCHVGVGAMAVRHDLLVLTHCMDTPKKH
jgi:hypothetical protein